ncbi:calmodulin-regulated spectrin-associated protein 1-B-like isoform X2 [Denticeps clupeoides]|uniref:calmodulin-regulated spectrin-associated protein 1-B-like isoform X2 n=1 Tax=Denticeps clupeoides TaxID=299321 RepID=UPI0010A301B5|nr:calmodulin-regulated spectrin-associated protein 1-B-like isoform X2 [Denticeps clupeoides]
MKKVMDRSARPEPVVAGDAGVIVPLDVYDSARAKIDANLRWLFAKAYGPGNVPEDQVDPFYSDQYGVEHIKPDVLQQLRSAELYCRVCVSIIRPEGPAAVTTHQAVIHTLGRHGIYAREPDGTPVSADDLGATPIKMSSHIPLIDGLMELFCKETVCVERCVTETHGSERPHDAETSMLLWINKVIAKLKQILEKELKLKQQLLESPCHQKSPSKWYWKLVPVRYRRDQPSCSMPPLPLLRELIDVCDGTALLATIHYYCPLQLRLEDVCLKEVASLADSVYNLQVLRRFSDQHLNSCLHITTEDLLYCPPVLKCNILAFLAELFHCFEIVKPEFVQPRDLQEVKDARAIMQPARSLPHIPVSCDSRRSFQGTFLAPEVMVTSQHFHSTKGSPASGPSHSLASRQEEEPLDLRNRSSSLDTHTRLAWIEKRQRPVSSMMSGDREWERVCASGVSTGDRACASVREAQSLPRSISKDSLAPNLLSTVALRPVNGHSPKSPVQTAEKVLTAFISDGSQAGFDTPHSPDPSHEHHPMESFFLEPLQAAPLRPAKERSDRTNKREECGEDCFRRVDVGCGSQRGGTQSVWKNQLEASEGFFLHDKPPSLIECVQPRQLTALESGKDSDWEIPDIEDEEEAEQDVVYQQEEAGKKLGGFHDDVESAKLRADSCMTERADKEEESISHTPSSLSISSSGTLTSFSQSRHRHGNSSSRASSLSTTPDGSENGLLANQLLQLRLQLEQKRRAIQSHQRKAEVVSARQRLQLGREAFLSVVKKGKSAQVQREGEGEKEREASKGERKREGEALKQPVFGNQCRVSPSHPTGLEGNNNVCEETELNETCRSIDQLNKAIHAIQQQMLQLSQQQEILLKRNTPQNTPHHTPQHAKHAGQKTPLHTPVCSPKHAKPNTPPQMGQNTAHYTPENAKQHPAVSSPQHTPKHTPQHTLTHVQHTHSSASETRPRASVHFVEAVSTPTRRPPRLSSSHAKSPKARRSKHGSEVTGTIPETGCEEEEKGHRRSGLVRGTARSTTFRVIQSSRGSCERPHTEPQLQPHPDNSDPQPDIITSKSQTDIPSDKQAGPRPGMPPQPHTRQHHPQPEPHRPVSPCIQMCESPTILASGGESVGSGKESEASHSEESSRSRAQLIEVGLSELEEGGDTDSETRAGLGFFFKDDQTAEDELARKRSAFLLKQQRKAEETRLRKLQLEAESEIKRDEARRKAEEDRVRKEEERVRKELIKQEYLRRKQEQLLEEQGLAKPKPRPKTKKSRPKSLQRGASGTTKPAVSLCSAPSASSLSLASDGLSGGSNRGDSVDSLRNVNSRTLDWDSRSTASSSTAAEYNGPRLFKEPSVKSNKSIIQNALSHCCLAGKVNESLKNSVLQDLEHCEANHFLILFRDTACQFRGLYSYCPETNRISRIIGNGPRSISDHMVDKLYKYSSDRKQFTLIPARSVCVSVDALTIHTHLWHTRRGSAPSRK